MRWFLALAFAGAFAFQAQAQETAIGPLCDTQEHLEYSANAFKETKSVQKALAAVNEKFGPVCAFIEFAYIAREDVADISVAGREGQIARVLVIAIKTEQGIAPVNPEFQFTIFLLPGRDA